MYVVHSKILCDADAILVHAVVHSERIVDRVKICEIRSEIYGASDHCPIVLEVAPAITSEAH